jgi:hypothetical protein
VIGTAARPDRSAAAVSNRASAAMAAAACVHMTSASATVATTSAAASAHFDAIAGHLVIGLDMEGAGSRDIQGECRSHRY